MDRIDASSSPAPRLAGLNLNLLVALDALLATASVSAAARRVGLTQSSMSHALARLRALLDDPLLVRSGRGMAPTPRARELAPAVEEALRRVAEVFAPREAFDPATARTRFRLAVPDVAQLLLLPTLYARLAREAPHVTLDIDPRAHGFDPEALASGAVDVTSAPRRPLPPGFHAREVVPAEPLVCLARCDHPELAARRLTLRRWLALPHVVVGTGGTVDRALEARGLVRQVALRVPAFLVLPWLVAETDMVAAVPRSVARRLARELPLALHRLPLRLDHEGILMIWHARTHAAPAHRWLRGLLAGIARERFGAR